MKQTLRFLLLTTSLLASCTTYSQSANDEVEQAVNRFFEGMRTGDSELVRSTLSGDVIFQSIVKLPDGAVQTALESADEFVELVGTPHEKIWTSEFLIWRSA